MGKNFTESGGDYSSTGAFDETKVEAQKEIDTCHHNRSLKDHVLTGSLALLASL